MPEEDTTKYFLISLIVQQLYREMLAVADEHGGKLPHRVMLFLDEIGTIPKIESAEMIFLASRSPRMSIVVIIQSFAQLEKNYGKEGAAIIVDNCQDMVFGGFAPNSESAEVLSKALGSKTRTNPMRTILKLFLEWGITFDKPYEIAEQSAHKVVYADRRELEQEIIRRHAACVDLDEEPAAPASSAQSGSRVYVSQRPGRQGWQMLSGDWYHCCGAEAVPQHC